MLIIRLVVVFFCLLYFSSHHYYDHFWSTCDLFGLNLFVKSGALGCMKKHTSDQIIERFNLQTTHT